MFYRVVLLRLYSISYSLALDQSDLHPQLLSLTSVGLTRHHVVVQRRRTNILHHPITLATGQAILNSRDRPFVSNASPAIYYSFLPENTT